MFEAGSAAARLCAVGLDEDEDVTWCARDSEIDIVPAVVERHDAVEWSTPTRRNAAIALGTVDHDGATRSIETRGGRLPATLPDLTLTTGLPPVSRSAP